MQVAHIERWHALLRAAGVGAAAIRNRHAVVRAALDQVVRWGWLTVNVATLAKLTMPKRSARSAMSADEVRRLIESALSVDLAAGVAMRLAAVSTARRSELAALRWEDVDGELLSIDSQIVEVRRPDEPTILVDEPTKTGNVRRIGLDAASLVLVTQLFEERSPCGAWMFNVGATTLTGSDDAVR